MADKKHNVSEKKLKNVKELSKLMDDHKTVMIASTTGLASADLQKSRKLLRSKAVIRYVKKSTAIKSIEASKHDGIKNLVPHVIESPALIFTDEDPFDIATILAENKFPAKAKEGQIAPADIKVEAGPTELLPGPVISEFGAAGIKAGIVGGKIAVKEDKIVVKAGEKINKVVVSILQKLEITPFEVGLEAAVAYDSRDRKVYKNIKINKEGMLSELKSAFSTAYQFALQIAYPCADTTAKIVERAEREAIALNNMLTQNNVGGN